MISVNNLKKHFGKNQVLKGIDLSLDKAGMITAILGPNGSGKTTLIKAILGMVIPSSGEIQVFGNSIRGQVGYRKDIAYLPQIARFPDNLTVSELFHMIRDLRGANSKESELVELFGLHPVLSTRLQNLSGGTRQKVNIALAFMYDCPLIILDEPTSGLDPKALIGLKQLIRREKAKGKMILMTTHIMSFVEEMADEIIFLLEGKIYFQGSVEEIRKKTGSQSLESAIAKLWDLQEESPEKGIQNYFTQKNGSIQALENIKIQ